MLNIFLSASVPYPDPNRNPLYLETANVTAIKASVKALTQVFVPEGNLVFGSHPAISPILALLMKQMPEGFHRRIRPYASLKWETEFNEEIRDFIEVIYTENIDDDAGKSLALMRNKMIGETRFDAGFFIGGMEGIIHEHEIFQRLNPHALVFPIASTGGAALELFHKTRSDDLRLSNGRSYHRLFRDIRDNLKSIKV